MSNGEVIVILCRQKINHQFKSIGKEMSPFLIFAIVLTIGYVLYYAAIITMDLNAKPKSGASAEENIVVGDSTDDQDEYKPKAVVKNPETGGFNFLDEGQALEPEVPEESNEEQPLPNEEDSALPPQQEEIISEGGEGTTDEHEDSSEDDDEELPVLRYSEQQAKDEEEVPEPFDESKVFDPELMQPKFGVSAIVEPEVSVKVSQHIERVNSSNGSIETKGNLVPSFDLAEVIRKKKENCNIDFKDEISKY